MDGPKMALLGLVLLCAVIGVILVAAADGKQANSDKDRQRKSNAKTKPHEASNLTVDEPLPGAQKKESQKSKTCEDEAASEPPKSQSRLGVPPPGEKRIEAVSPRSAGSAKR